MNLEAARQACRDALAEIQKATDPAREPGWKAIHRVADQAKPQWKRDFLAAVRATQDAADIEAVEAALARGDSEAAYQAVDWTAMQALDATWKGRILDLMGQGAEIAAREIPKARTVPVGEPVLAPPPPALVFAPVSAPPRPRPPTTTAAPPTQPPAAVLELRFDITNPEAVRWAETRSANLVAGLVGESGEATKQQIQRAVTRAFNEGVPPRQLAREIKTMVGLTDRDTRAVERYRAGLEKTIKPEAVRREQRIENQADRYAAKLLNRRAENIARTETMLSSNRGQQELWRQAKEQDLLGDRVQKWLITPDDRLCPICAQMRGERAFAELGENFDVPGIGLVSGPPAHPSCRCSLSSFRRSKMEASL